jgi:hypothetical protein
MLKKSDDPEYEKLQKIKISQGPSTPNNPKLFGYPLKDVPRFLIFLVFANIIFGLYVTSFYNTFGYSLPEFLLGIVVLKLIYVFGDIYLSINTYLNLSNYFDAVFHNQEYKNFLEYPWLRNNLSIIYNSLATTIVFIIFFSIYKMIAAGSIPHILTFLILMGSEMVSSYLIKMGINAKLVDPDNLKGWK